MIRVKKISFADKIYISKVSLLVLEDFVSRQHTMGAAAFSAVLCIAPVPWLCLGLQ